ncbi:MAG: hypothetical protein PHQ34_04815, partial [Methanothrix sp.]|nr:hypothetical protein [Methanothrix sp.]
MTGNIIIKSSNNDANALMVFEDEAFAIVDSISLDNILRHPLIPLELIGITGTGSYKRFGSNF